MHRNLSHIHHQQVVDSLRLDLAQYRELEAFTKFGSELDKSTQAQLSRGERLIEILKQPQYAPCATEDQVIIIYAAEQGLLDDVPVERVQEFEKKFIEFVSQSHADVRDALRKKKELTEDLAEKLKALCEEFKGTFLGTDQ